MGPQKKNRELSIQGSHLYANDRKNFTVSGRATRICGEQPKFRGMRRSFKASGQAARVREERGIGGGAY